MQTVMVIGMKMAKREKCARTDRMKKNGRRDRWERYDQLNNSQLLLNPDENGSIMHSNSHKIEN
jgi:hypothetical protein